jgi:hypothetical protein
LSPIKDFLREDVKERKHEGLTSSEFQASRREYRKIDATKFKERLYQEQKRKKFLFHWELDRIAKGRKVPATYKQVK